MNWKSISFLCLLLIGLCGSKTYSQAKLQITSVTSLPSDTVVYPNTSWITYYVTVENVGNDQLTAPCSIKAYYNGGSQENVLKSWVASSFEVGETTTLTINDTIDGLGNGRYDGGVNILVIWPHNDNPNSQAPDTTDYEIVILDLTIGVIDPKELDQRVEVFPNPARDHLNIRYLQPQHKVEYVRIVGLDGRIQLQTNSAVESLDLSALPAGMYMVVFDFKDGSVGAQRFTKPN